MRMYNSVVLLCMFSVSVVLMVLISVMVGVLISSVVVSNSVVCSGRLYCWVRMGVSSSNGKLFVS